VVGEKKREAFSVEKSRLPCLGGKGDQNDDDPASVNEHSQGQSPPHHDLETFQLSRENPQEEGPRKTKREKIPLEEGGEVQQSKEKAAQSKNLIEKMYKPVNCGAKYGGREPKRGRASAASRREGV